MKEPNSEVYNIDCMEYMKNIPDKYFELAVVDPPYGIGQPKQANLKGYKGRQSLEDRLYKNRLNNGSGKLKDRVLNTSNCDWDNKIPSNEYFIELFRVSKNQIIWGGNYFPLPPSRCILCGTKFSHGKTLAKLNLLGLLLTVQRKYLNMIIEQVIKSTQHRSLLPYMLGC